MRIWARLSPAIVALLLSGVLVAQEFRANITGRVVDASGAAVPASISVRHIDTNIENAVKADSGGEFTVPFSMNGGAVAVHEILIDGASNTTQGGSGTGTGVGISAGDKDFALAGAQGLDKMLIAHNVKHSFTETPGVHEWKVWRLSLNQFAPLLFQ